MRGRFLFSLDLRRLSCYEIDFLVLGSGIAGLFAAHKARAYGSVLLLTKQHAEDSATEMAQGGIAAAVGEEDSPALHLEDTLAAGAGLCDPGAVEILVTEGPRHVMELVSLGARFDREGDTWHLAREGAHRRRRILHASDATGEEIASVLLAACRADPRISLREGCFLVDILRSPRTGRCAGALFWDEGAGSFAVCRARVTILATGGAGQLYLHTTNPPVATGDGMAAAYRAGAELADLEFIQFHPTALVVPGAPRFLVSEAVRGEGAWLRNVQGRRFLPRYHELAELAPRDVVARAIFQEMRETETPYVYLDISLLGPAFRERFPNIWRACKKYGLDPESGYLPVAPAAHFVMGGVKTDHDGSTSIPGLFACGEVACTGVHGANRLASNSLLEGLVFSARAVEAGRRFLEEELPELPEVLPEEEVVFRGTGGCSWEEIALRVRSLMWEKVGIVRTGEGLAAARAELQELFRNAPSCKQERASCEAANLLTLALLVAGAAWQRTESRGSHFRVDYPGQNDLLWRRHIVFQV